MPNVVIELGRSVAAVIVFALCAFFSAVALVPCWYLYHAIEAASSTMWAVLSTPFLYGVWGFTYCACCVVLKWVLFYRPKAGSFPLFSWPIVGWGLTGATTNFANVFFLVHFKGTPVLNLWFRLLGAKIGARVSINTCKIFDWDLIRIDDDVVLGGDCVVMAHALEGSVMRMRPVHIGAKATVGGEAKVMPGATIGDGGVLGASSLLSKDSTIGAREIWGGIPARFIRARAAKGETAEAPPTDEVPAEPAPKIQESDGAPTDPQRKTTDPSSHHAAQMQR